MNISESRFSVKGMKCGNCVANATAAVSKLPGYEASQFDLKTGSAIVRGNVDPQAVVRALTAAGYPAELRNG